MKFNTAVFSKFTRESNEIGIFDSPSVTVQIEFSRNDLKLDYLILNVYCTEENDEFGKFNFECKAVTTIDNNKTIPNADEIMPSIHQSFELINESFKLEANNNKITVVGSLLFFNEKFPEKHFRQRLQELFDGIKY